MTTRHRRRLIWFCQTESVAAQPDTLARLRDRIGLTTIMPESPVSHTSGFRSSAELAARGPFEDWREREHLWPRGRDGIYPPVAGIVGGFDDTPLRRLLDTCARLDIEVWGHLGLWSYGGDVFPELAMRDIYGRALDPRYGRWGTGLCPSRPEVVEWVHDGLRDAIARYGLSSFCVDHARYPAPANLHSLLGCGCAHCVGAASGLGYEAESIHARLHRWLQASGRQEYRRLRALLASRASLGEFLYWLGDDDVVIEWLRCRAALLAARMRECRDVIRQAAGPEAVFGSDVFAPSIALLGGQQLNQWEQSTDFLTGGSSYGGVVGWASGVTHLAGEGAPALCGLVPGLKEREALQLIYRLFGYDDLDLPDSLEGLSNQALPVETIFSREIQRLVAATSGVVPLYPPVSAQGPLERVESLCRAVADAGCDGAMLGLNPEDEAVLDVIAGTW